MYVCMYVCMYVLCAYYICKYCAILYTIYPYYMMSNVMFHYPNLRKPDESSPVRVVRGNASEDKHQTAAGITHRLLGP